MSWNWTEYHNSSSSEALRKFKKEERLEKEGREKKKARMGREEGERIGLENFRMFVVLETWKNEGKMRVCTQKNFEILS